MFSLETMAIAVSNLLTTDDYRVLGEGPPHYQLIEGKLLMSPSPNRYHQVVCRNLLLLLGKHLEGNPMGEVYHAPSDVYLTDHDVYQPDLFYVSKANASILTEQGVAGAPDLVMEILSPGSAQMDREVKRKVYLQCGVKELWLVDPDLKSVQVYRANPQGEPQVNTYYVGSSIASPLLPGLTIPVESVFKPPPLG